jgi:hypothetical protein
VEARIEVAAGISSMVNEDGDRARRMQASIGEQFSVHFGAGLAAVGIEKGQESSVYLLSPWESK